MSELFDSEGDSPSRIYWDRKQFANFDDQLQALKGSKLLYIGNLSFFTTELQIQHAFSQIGPIKRIIMGLNANTKTPCGFCFVEYFSQQHTADCLKYLSLSMCDEQVIRCELDAGFVAGRQFGRGSSGGQTRDDRNGKTNLARGGLVCYGLSDGDGSLGRLAAPAPIGNIKTMVTHAAAAVLTGDFGKSTYHNNNYRNNSGGEKRKRGGDDNRYRYDSNAGGGLRSQRSMPSNGSSRYAADEGENIAEEALQQPHKNPRFRPESDSAAIEEDEEDTDMNATRDGDDDN